MLGGCNLLIALEEMGGLTVTLANLSSCYFVLEDLFRVVDEPLAERVNNHLVKDSAAKTTVPDLECLNLV